MARKDLTPAFVVSDYDSTGLVRSNGNSVYPSMSDMDGTTTSMAMSFFMGDGSHQIYSGGANCGRYLGDPEIIAFVNQMKLRIDKRTKELASVLGDGQKTPYRLESSGSHYITSIYALGGGTDSINATCWAKGTGSCCAQSDCNIGVKRTDEFADTTDQGRGKGGDNFGSTFWFTIMCNLNYSTSACK